MTYRLLFPLIALALLAACQRADPRANKMIPTNQPIASAQSVDMMDDSIETADQ